MAPTDNSPARPRHARGESGLAWVLVLPAVGVVALVAVFPLAWTIWESFHLHDLRMPWRGRPWVGLANYAEALTAARFWEAIAHTAIFAVVSIALELVLGFVLALLLHHAYRGRGFVRAAALIPWAIPTVVAALVWRFMFEGDAGVVNATLVGAGLVEEPVRWLGHERAAWVPLILADVWKTTPFVALLILAGLQNIDGSLYEAARMDGATAWGELWHVTLPMIKPALLVALIFRTLDAIRVFDLVYVLTAGGPGTATEPIALYSFIALMQRLRFGYGSALSVLIFLLSFGLALVYVRLLGRDLLETRS